MAQSFPDALNELLKGAGISGNKLAERLEVDPSQVSRWRKGEGTPRPENIGRLAEIFKVDRHWLLGLAYPSGDVPPAVSDPHWAAFIAEIETGWRVMDRAARDMAERGARALFSVPPTDAYTHPARNGKTPRQPVSSRQKPDENNPLQRPSISLEWPGHRKSMFAMTS